MYVKSFGQIKMVKPKNFSFAICIPLGLGIQKAFNSDIGIKIEAG